MKEKNQVALGAIRMLRSEIRNAEIDKSGDLDDEEIVRVVKSSIKKRKDSANQYRDAGRDDLAAKEEEEIEVLEKYMPKQLSEEEIKEIIAEEMKELDIIDKKHFGRIMKEVMAKVGNRADGKLVSKMVKEAFDADN
jgi:hypothetical protein